MKRETLEMLIYAHEAEVYRYVKYLGADHALAQDVAQDTFLAAFRSQKTPPMEDERRRGAWLRGIARNRFLTHCRRAKTSPVKVNSEALEVAEAFWAQQMETEEDMQPALDALDTCLQALPERSRILLRMRYTENRSREAMATALDMQPEGVKTALRRIRELLAGCIRKQLGDGEPR